VDFVMGYGPLLFGHAPPVVVQAAERQLVRGMTYGAQHELEPVVARAIVEVVPGAEQVVLATTGSEAVAVALRLARAATGRSIVVKFEGHYHGWLDGVFAGSSADPDGADPPSVHPATAGIPASALLDLRIARWNSLASLREVVGKDAHRVAAVICEPLAVNAGVIGPAPGFLQELRAWTRDHGIVLIFDEIITGFRIALGGAQERYAVQADLAVFGKAIAGGIPLSAVTGPRDVMAAIADGRLAHNGTFNGNPVALSGAAAVLTHLRSDGAHIYPMLERLGRHLAQGLAEVSPRLQVRQVGSIVSAAVDEPSKVQEIRDRASGRPAVYARFVEALLMRGIHTTPRGLWYVSTAHAEPDIDAAIAAARAAARQVLS
jgi:glutamate-1-semialdehyde 2,1-aminomutase